MPMSEQRYLIKIQVVTKDRPGLLVEIFQLLSAVDLGIHAIEARSLQDQRTITTFSIEIMDTQKSELIEVTEHMRTLEDVHSVLWICM